MLIQATEFFTFNSEGKLVHLETLTNDLGALTQFTNKQPGCNATHKGRNRFAFGLLRRVKWPTILIFM